MSTTELPTAEMSTSAVSAPVTATAREDWQLAGDAWEHAAKDWAYGFEPYARDAVEALFSQLGVGRDTRLLDIACGSGYALGRAERLGASTAGIDASAGLIEIARRRAPGADLVAGDMFRLPWEDGSFDAITSFNGIWGGCQDAVNEAARVLRPGGSMAITFWGPGNTLDLRDYFIVVGSTAPGTAEEMIGLAAIGAPGVCEGMFEAAGLTDPVRGTSSAIIEAHDDDDLWRILRSPGVVHPSLMHVGEDELRCLTMEAAAPYCAADGTYRFVNQLDYVIATKPAH